MQLRRLACLIAMGLIPVAGAYAQDAPANKALVPSPPNAIKTDRMEMPEFGTTGDHRVAVGPSEFAPDGTSAQYWTNTWVPPGVTNWRGYFNSASAYPHVYAWVHAPGGSIFDYVELDYCDTDATYAVTMDVYGCGYLSDCSSTPLATLVTNTSAGCGFLTANPNVSVVDNNNYKFLLDVSFPSAGPHDGSLALGGAIIGWKYQVHPAPGSATFPDVPTSDFGFQYVEALNASGITGGCGSGNYCPDSPVTRRQMAIFIAKALGLYWGGY